MRTILTVCLLSLSACSISTGGMYMATGSHPHVAFTIKATAGPVEVLHSPTTQRGTHDLYTAGLYPNYNVGAVAITMGAGWSWWRDWSQCFEVCNHSWTNGITAGGGVVYENGHARVDVRGQVFSNAPYDAGLIFTAGYAF